MMPSISKDFWDALNGKEQSWAAPMATFAGMPVIADSMLCEWVEFQRKTHRKSRINKKWAKKHGFDRRCVKAEASSVMGKFVACPHVIEAMTQGMVRTYIQATIQAKQPSRAVLHSTTNE